PAALIASMGDFEKSIQIDPSFAPAHAGLAKTYHNMGYSSVMLPGEAYPLARQEAQKALTLDPANEDARLTLIVIRVEKEWDFKGAEAEYKQFIEKHPNNATVYASYADLLAALGRFDEALATTKRAIDFNPQSVDLAMREGWIE